MPDTQQDQAQDQDGSQGQDGGHEQDAEEDADDYIDRLFSREYVWSVVIGGAIWGGLSNVIGYAVTGNLAMLKVAVGMFLATPLLVAGGAYWPAIEQRYAAYLPYMDDSAGGDA